MASFMELPRELHCMIFTMISSPQDLYNYIRASRVIYQTFAMNSEAFLSLVLKNSIHPAAQPWALALNFVPAMESGFVARDMLNFLEDHFRRGKPARTFPSDRVSLVALARQNLTMNRFIQHFARTALCRTATPAAKTNPWHLELVHDLQEIKAENDREPGTLPYWAALNDEHRQECRFIELQAVSSLTTTEIARLQRAFYTYEFYCRVVQPTSIEVHGSLLSCRQQYEWILAHIPEFHLEEMFSVHQYYMAIAGKLFDQIESELVADVLALPHTVLRPIPPAQTRLHFALQQNKWNRMNLRELQDHLVKMDALVAEFKDEYTGHPKDPDTTYFLSSAIPVLCRKPNNLVRLASQRPSQILQSYCDGHSSSFISRDEASFLSSRGAMYIKDVLCSSKSNRLKLLRQNLETDRAFFTDALHWKGNDPSRSSDPSQAVDRPPEDDLNFPNFGWYACDHVQSRTNPLYDPYREVGYVFWDERRMIEEPLRGRLIEINENFEKTMREAVSWPRSRGRASSRLQSIMVKSEDMESIIRKYCSTANEIDSLSSFITL